MADYSEYVMDGDDGNDEEYGDVVDEFAAFAVEGDGDEEDADDAEVRADEAAAAARGGGIEAIEFKKFILKQVETDCAELDSLKYVHATSNANRVSGKITVLLSMSKERFNISKERASAYLIDASKDICMKLEFGQNYCGDVLSHTRTLKEIQPACCEVDEKIVEAVVKSTCDLTGTLFKESKKSALAWYIQKSLSAYLKGDMQNGKLIAGCWPPHLNPRGGEEEMLTKFIRADTQQVMKVYEIDEDAAKAVLDACGDDLDKALAFRDDNFDKFSEAVNSAGKASTGATKEVEGDNTDAKRAAQDKKTDIFLKEQRGKYDGLPKDAVSGLLLKLRKRPIEKKLKELDKWLAPPISDAAGGPTVWEWKNRSGWQRYSDKQKAELEAFWVAFKTKGGPSDVVMKIKSKAYKVDLKTMKQLSPRGYYRLIRRTGAAATESEKAQKAIEKTMQKYAAEYCAWVALQANEAKGIKLTLKLQKSMPSADYLKLGRQASSTKDMLAARMKALEDGMRPQNFLVRIVHKCEEAIKKYTTNCIMCSDPLEFPGAKPSICDKELCGYKFNALALGVDIGTALQEQTDIFTLLIGNFWNACNTTNKAVWPRMWDLKDWKLCYPYMIASAGESREHDVFYPEDYAAKKLQTKGLKNIKELSQHLEKPRQMAQWAEMGRDSSGAVVLNKKMAGLSKGGLLLPVVRWLYTSNRAHIRRLESSEMITKVQSKYQFVLMTSSAEKEKRFQELKRDTAFARKILGVISGDKIFNEINKQWQTRKADVFGLLADSNNLYKKKAILHTALKAVEMAQKRLMEKNLSTDIDNMVVKTACDILNDNAGLPDACKLTLDFFKAQVDEFTKMGAKPAVDSKARSCATNASPIGNKGTYWAWHGAPLDKWHFILRTGLRNLSGKKLMMNASAYGSGVYFAKDLNTCLGYAANQSSTYHWPKLEFDGNKFDGKNVRMASMVEIINRPEDFTSISPYYVVPEENYLKTHFLFLFEGNPTSVNAMDVKIPDGLVH